MTRSHAPADSHADHDALLVAALVSGDLEGLEADAARALVAECRACAELASDLAAMTAAVRELPPPVRTRDFRISPEQAAAIDRRGIRRFMPAAGRPGLGLARPLGTGLAALGVAGLLFTSVMGGQLTAILPSAGSSGAAVPGYAASLAPEAASTSAADNGSKAAPSSPGAIAASSPAAVPSAAASPAAVASAAASPAAVASGAGTPAPPPSGQREPEPSSTSIAPALVPSTTSPPSPAGAPAPGTVPSPSGGIPLLPAASIAVLLAGLGLLGADLVARRH